LQEQPKISVETGSRPTEPESCQGCVFDIVGTKGLTIDLLINNVGFGVSMELLPT